jgi:phosphotransferase system  glucose/maltose/N-acetylglucosamine-specific IIC component
MEKITEYRALFSDIMSLVGAVAFIVAAFLIGVIWGLVAIGVFSFIISWFTRDTHKEADVGGVV